MLKALGALKKENRRLKEELQTAAAKISGNQQQVEELKQQVSVLKVSAGSMNEADKKEMEKRINGYLKEIDRCIALLGD